MQPTKITEFLMSNEGKEFSFSELSSQFKDERFLRMKLNKLVFGNQICAKSTHSGKVFFYAKETPVEKKKDFKKNILVLIATVLIMIVILEIGVRIYYATTDKIIAKNEYELMEKELYKQLTDESNPARFLYGKAERWDNDELLGLVPKAGWKIEQFLELNINDTHKAKARVYTDYFNSRGMAVFNEFRDEKNESMTRIALLGDSFTLGDDVLPKFNFANMLYELIPNSEILNYGMSGKGTSYMYVAYEKKAKKLSPDIVVMNIMIDDISRNGAGEAQFRQPEVFIDGNRQLQIKDKKIPSYRAFLKSYNPPSVECYLCKFVSYKISKMNYKQRSYDFGLKTWDKELDILDNETNGKLLVSVFLSTPDLDSDYNRSYEIYLETKDMLNRKGIPYLDGVELFKKELPKYGDNETKVFFKKEATGHFSEIGYGVFSMGLKNRLVDLNWVNKTVQVDTFVYRPEGLAMFLVNNQILTKQITAYEIIEVIPK